MNTTTTKNPKNRDLIFYKNKIITKKTPIIEEKIRKINEELKKQEVKKKTNNSKELSKIKGEYSNKQGEYSNKLGEYSNQKANDGRGNANNYLNNLNFEEGEEEELISETIKGFGGKIKVFKLNENFENKKITEKCEDIISADGRILKDILSNRYLVNNSEITSENAFLNRYGKKCDIN